MTIRELPALRPLCPLSLDIARDRREDGAEAMEQWLDAQEEVTRIESLTMQKQEGDFICWAAVTQPF